MEFNLVDGSVVTGTLISFENDVYTVESTTLGTLRIEAAKIRSIKVERSPDSLQDAVQSLQERMRGDTAVMELIRTLEEDPDFQAILADEEILRAITSGDLNSLENNGKMQNLMNKSTLKEIERLLRQPQ